MKSVVLLSAALRSAVALWIGVMAGFFYAFSVVVMPGLSTADLGVAMEAMQAINDSVRNFAFAAGFFGAPVVCLIAIVHAAVRRDWPAAWLVIAGVLIYLIGATGVTFLVNVPLNEDLALLDPALPENHAEMLSYIDEWSIWNNVRTVASVVACVFILCSQIVSQTGIKRAS